MLRAGRGGTTESTVIVETMGFGDEAYRGGKALIHPLMSAALGGARVIEHDFHLPAGMPQARRDAALWQAVRWALGGTERPKADRGVASQVVNAEGQGFRQDAGSGAARRLPWRERH